MVNSHLDSDTSFKRFDVFINDELLSVQKNLKDSTLYQKRNYNPQISSNKRNSKRLSLKMSLPQYCLTQLEDLELCSLRLEKKSCGESMDFMSTISLNTLFSKGSSSSLKSRYRKGSVLSDVSQSSHSSTASTVSLNSPMSSYFSSQVSTPNRGKKLSVGCLSNCQFKGYVNKLSTTIFNAKVWKPKYVVISNTTICIFKTDSLDNLCKETIQLTPNFKLSVVQNVFNKTKALKLSDAIATHHFNLETEEELVRWYDVIDNAISRSKFEATRLPTTPDTLKLRMFLDLQSMNFINFDELKINPEFKFDLNSDKLKPRNSTMTTKCI